MIFTGMFYMIVKLMLLIVALVFTIYGIVKINRKKEITKTDMVDKLTIKTENVDENIVLLDQKLNKIYDKFQLVEKNQKRNNNIILIILLCVILSMMIMTIYQLIEIIRTYYVFYNMSSSSPTEVLDRYVRDLQK